MIMMLKKCGVIIILMLVLVSFTVGSVGSTQSGTNKSKMTGELDQYGLPPLPILAPLPDPGMVQGMGGRMMGGHGYTVTLDLSGQDTAQADNVAGHGEFYRVSHVSYIKDGGEFMAGRVIVKETGSDDAPQIFPVKLPRNPVVGMVMAGRPPVDLYRLNEAFKMSHDMSGKPSGFVMCSQEEQARLDGSGEAYFILNGNVSVLEYNATDDVVNGTYDNSIVQGQTVYHQAEVAGAATAFNFDLKWNNLGDDMRLMVYTPDGHVLGPYTDASDGKTDGRINMEIDNPNGVADGTWILKVTGTNVSGKDDYNIKTW